jgi:hypothetical protein
VKERAREKEIRMMMRIEAVRLDEQTPLLP